MKNILFTILLIFGISCSSLEKKEIEYIAERNEKVAYWFTNDKKREDIVKKAIYDWKGSGIKYQKVNSGYPNSVHILFVDKERMEDPEWLGQQVGNRIMVNKDVVNGDALIRHVVAHEFGHWIGLDHNNKNSIMNINLPYSTKVTDYDIKEAEKLLQNM